MRIVSLAILVFTLIFCPSLSADFCVGDEGSKAEGCSMLVNTGSPMDPVLMFQAKRGSETLEWKMGVRILGEEWLMLKGGAEIRIDGVSMQELEVIQFHRAEVKEKLMSESVFFNVDEKLLEAIASSSDEVALSISTEESDPIEITAKAGAFSKLADFLAEARNKL